MPGEWERIPGTAPRRCAAARRPGTARLGGFPAAQAQGIWEQAAIAQAGRFIDGSCPLISGQLRYVSD